MQNLFPITVQPLLQTKVEENNWKFRAFT